MERADRQKRHCRGAQMTSPSRGRSGTATPKKKATPSPAWPWQPLRSAAAAAGALVAGLLSLAEELLIGGNPAIGVGALQVRHVDVVVRHAAAQPRRLHRPLPQRPRGGLQRSAYLARSADQGAHDCATLLNAT